MIAERCNDGPVSGKVAQELETGRDIHLPSIAGRHQDMERGTAWSERRRKREPFEMQIG